MEYKKNYLYYITFERINFSETTYLSNIFSHGSPFQPNKDLRSTSPVISAGIWLMMSRRPMLYQWQWVKKKRETLFYC